jgi:hypothetical protein
MVTKSWHEIITGRLELCRKNKESGIDCDNCILELEENCICLDCTQDCEGCDHGSNFLSVVED